jgi:hypothetical protein
MEGAAVKRAKKSGKVQAPAIQPDPQHHGFQFTPGGIVPWTSKRNPDGTVEIVEPRGYRAWVERMGREDDARRASAEGIDKAIARLRDMRGALGATRYLDAKLARQVDRVLAVLENDADDVLARDLLRRLVVDEAERLARARRAGDVSASAASVADETIAKCAAASPEIVPFGSKLGEHRAKLVAAIEASSARGRAAVSRGAAADATLKLLKAMGLGAGSVEALKRSSARARRR